MKLKKVTSAELVRYNANSSGNMSPDCVKRAISLAFDISYTETAKLLNTRMKEMRKSAWNIASVYETVIKDLAANASHIEKVTIPIDERTTLQDFVDNEVDRSCVYLVLTGRKKTASDHIVCVRDGKIFDSWDSRDQWVTDYWVIEGLQSKALTNIKESMNDLANYVLHDLVNNQIVAYMQKKKWNYGPIDVDTRKKDYQLIAHASLMLKPTEEIDKKRYYDFKIVIALSPTMTEDEAKEFILKSGKQKVYDKMWAINEEEKKLAEEESVAKKLYNKDYEPGKFLSHWMSGQEKRFINSLPGWIRPLVTYLNISEPGQYHDSYRLTIKAHPDDPTRDVSQKIDFEGYDSDMVKSEIERYITTWEAPFEDYYPADEY